MNLLCHVALHQTCYDTFKSARQMPMNDKCSGIRCSYLGSNGKNVMPPSNNFFRFQNRLSCKNLIKISMMFKPAFNLDSLNLISKIKWIYIFLVKPHYQ